MDDLTQPQWQATDEQDDRDGVTPYFVAFARTTSSVLTAVLPRHRHRAGKRSRFGLKKAPLSASKEALDKIIFN
jgi:hypothetical protein